MEKTGPPVVVDVGTYSTKIGFAGEKTPSAVVRTLMAKDPKLKTWVFGDAVLPIIDDVKLRAPISNGVILDPLVNFTRFMSHLLTRVLEIDSSGHPLLFLVNGKGLCDWDGVANRLFNKLDLPALSMIRSSMACLYALGHSTALIAQVGAGHTTVAGFVNFYGTQRTIPRLYLGSQKDVDVILHRELVRKGFLPNSLGGLEMAREIKEQVAYTAQDYDRDAAGVQKSGVTATAIIPNGTEIECGVERLLAPEVFFKPNLNEHPIVGLDEVIADAVLGNKGLYRRMHADFRKSNEEIQQQLASRIYLTGGHVKMPGFLERIQRDVSARLPAYPISVTVPPRSDDLEWFGGSQIAGNGEPFWVSKQRWETAGKSFIRAIIPDWGEGDYF